MLDWTFSPHDYFEEVIEIAGHGYTMTIVNDGHVQAKIASSLYHADPDIRERLQNDLNSRFLGVQLLTYSPYELSGSRMTRLHPGGRKDYFMEAEPANLTVTISDTAEFQLIRNGNVVADLKRDRIEEKARVAELVSCSSGDTMLRSLLQSYQAAINDPNNELVHLYEISDALAKRFGGKQKAAQAAAQKALGITRTQWS